jgi:hypothetical protein
MSKGWGAVVRGHQFDLDDWIDVLKSPFDPWVEVHGPDIVLRSKSLDDLSSSTEARDRALIHIERLNGAMAVSRESQPLQFGGVVELTADGKLHRTMFVEGAVFGRSKVRAVAVTLGLDGNPKPSPPAAPNEVQDWAKAADEDELLEDALIYFGRVSEANQTHAPTFWFDIYKALECLILRFGPGEAEFLAQKWAPSAEIVNLKRTANWARHARRKFDPPKHLVSAKEARDLMVQLLRKSLGK